MSNLATKYYNLQIVNPYRRSSDFLNNLHLSMTQLIIDRLPKNFELIAGDMHFNINQKIISSLSPYIHSQIQKDKNFNKFTFKKAAAFSVFPFFCRLLEGKEVNFDNESLILLKKLLKELQINFTKRDRFSYSVRSRQNQFGLIIPRRDNCFAISFTLEFFKSFEKKFIISTRHYQYECTIPNIFISDLLYRKVKEIEESAGNDNSKDSKGKYNYFYDVDDEYSEYKKGFLLFTDFNASNYSSAQFDFDILLKVANDFEITFLPPLIHKLFERRAFVDKKLSEYDFTESIKLMNYLLTFEEKDTDNVYEYLQQSIWTKDNDHLKELAFCISYASSIRLNRILPLCDLSSRLGSKFLTYLDFVLYYKSSEYSKFKLPTRYYHHNMYSLANNFGNELYNRKILLTKLKLNQHARIPIFQDKNNERMHHGYRSYNRYSKYAPYHQVIFQFNKSEDVFKRIIYLDDIDKLKTIFDIQIFSQKPSKSDINYFTFAIFCGSVKCYKFLRSLNMYSYELGLNDLSIAVQGGNYEIAQLIYNDPCFDGSSIDPIYVFPKKFNMFNDLSGKNKNSSFCKKIIKNQNEQESKENVNDISKKKDDINDNNDTKEKRSIVEMEYDGIISCHNKHLYDQKFFESHCECLSIAIKSNNFEVVKMCKDLIADLNHGAILEDLLYNGFIDMFFFILSLQPDVDEALIQLNNNSFEESPNLIYFAATTGSVRAVRFLYEHAKKFKGNNSNYFNKYSTINFDLIFSIATDNADLDMIQYIIDECGYKPPYNSIAQAIKKNFFPGKTSFAEFFYKRKLTPEAWMPVILEIVATGNTESSFEILKEISLEIQKETERIKEEHENEEKTNKESKTNENISKESKNEENENNNSNENNNDISNNDKEGNNNEKIENNNVNNSDNLNNDGNDNGNDNNNQNDNNNNNNNNNNNINDPDNYKFMIKNIDSAFERAFLLALTYGRKNNIEFLSKFNMENIDNYRLSSVIQYATSTCHLRSLYTFLNSISNYNERLNLAKAGLIQALDTVRHPAVKFFIVFDKKILDDDKILIELMINGYTSDFINTILRKSHKRKINRIKSKSENTNKNKDSNTNNEKNENNNNNFNDNDKLTEENVNNEDDEDEDVKYTGNEDDADDFEEIDYLKKIDLSKLSFEEIDQYISKAVSLERRNNEDILRLLLSQDLFNPNHYICKAISSHNYRAFKILLEYFTPRNPIIASAINESFFTLCDSEILKSENKRSKNDFSIEGNIVDTAININVNDPYGTTNPIYTSHYYNDFSQSAYGVFDDDFTFNRKSKKIEKRSKKKIFIIKDDNDVKKIFNDKEISEDEIIDTFLNFHDIDVNYSSNSTPLIIAATINKKVKIVKALANHPDIDLNATDKDSLTAIMHALKIGDKEIFDILYYNPKIKINKLTFMNRSALSFAVLGLPEVVPFILSNENIKKLNDNKNFELFDAEKSHAEVAAAAAFSQNNFDLFSLILKCDFDINRHFTIRPKKLYSDESHYIGNPREIFGYGFHESIIKKQKALPKNYSERNLLEIIAIFGQSTSIPFLRLVVNHPRFVDIENKHQDNDNDDDLPVLPSDVVNAAIMKAAENPFQNAEMMKALLHIGGHDVNYSIEKTPLIVFAAYNNNTNLIKMIISSPEYDVGYRKLREKPLLYKKRKKISIMFNNKEDQSKHKENESESPSNDSAQDNGNNNNNNNGIKENANDKTKNNDNNTNNDNIGNTDNNNENNRNINNSNKNVNNNNDKNNNGNNNESRKENESNNDQNNTDESEESEYDEKSLALIKNVDLNDTKNPRIYFSAQTHAAFCIALFMNNISSVKLLMDLVDVNDYAPSNIRYPCSASNLENSDRDSRRSMRLWGDDTYDLSDYQNYDDFNDDFYSFNDPFYSEKKSKYGLDSKLRVVKINNYDGICGINGIDSSNISNITKVINNNGSFFNNGDSTINLAGKTPLTLAIISGNDLLFRILDNKNELDLNKPNRDGSLPIFYSLKSPSMNHDIFLSGSFNANVTDLNGETVLMKLLKSEDLHSCWLYLKRDDIDLMKVDNRGNSVRSILDKKGVDTSELGKNPTNEELLAFVRKYVDGNEFHRFL